MITAHCSQFKLMVAMIEVEEKFCFPLNGIFSTEVFLECVNAFATENQSQCVKKFRN